MLNFLTPTALPIEAATTMGVSVKEDGAIGKFGTGLKYAIAGILRLAGTITIYVDGERHDFEAKDADIRGRMFRIVHHNGTPCGFTTELGKHWEPWQLFRELASNTIDESGSWTRDAVAPTDARTVIEVRCREVEDAERSEQVFIPKADLLIGSSMGASVYAGPTPYYYYRGIRAGSFGCMAPVTVDVSSGSLSEDRLLDLSQVRSELSWAMHSATHFDERLMLSIMAQCEPGGFWYDNLETHIVMRGLPPKLMQFVQDRPKFAKHPAFRKALDAHIRAGGRGRWQEITATDRHLALIAQGERICIEVGVDPIPRKRVHFTRDLGDETLAVTCMDTRDVWFSTKLAMLGRDEFLSGYLEEAMHAMTGFADCTRELQNALLSLIVTNATSATALKEAA